MQNGKKLSHQLLFTDIILCILEICELYILTLCIVMDSSFWFNTINFEQYIVHVWVCQVIT